MENHSGNILLGAWGEKKAASYLREQGYEVICSNYRCSYGEIDLVCKEGSVWCFVEVKTRKKSSYGQGFHAVTAVKQKHLIQAAQQYLNETGRFDVPARFDLISIDFYAPKSYRIQLFKNIIP